MATKGKTLNEYFTLVIPELIQALYQEFQGTNTGFQEKDLIQEANLILLQQKQNYPKDDLQKSKNRLYTTVSRHIKELLIRSQDLFNYYDECSNQSNGFIGLMMELFTKLPQTQKTLEEKLQRTPTFNELAQALDIPVDKLHRYIKARGVILANDLSPEEFESYQLIPDKKQNPSILFDQIEIHHKINLVLATLTHREEKILRLRFGISEKYDFTLDEVGDKFKISRERAKQIESKALRKLRHPILANILKSFNDSLLEELD